MRNVALLKLLPLSCCSASVEARAGRYTDTGVARQEVSIQVRGGWSVRIHPRNRLNCPLWLSDPHAPQLVQLGAKLLPAKLRPRRKEVDYDVLRLRKWIDPNTAIIFARAIWHDTKAAYLFTVKSMAKQQHGDQSRTRNAESYQRLSRLDRLSC